MKFPILFAPSFVGVQGHGYMANPVSRGVLWSTTPHGIGAIGPGKYVNTCGNSGANGIIHGNKDTNKYVDTRDCISTLKIGSIFRVHSRIKAHHLGVQEVRLCGTRLSDPKADIDDCLELERATAEEAGVDCANHDDFGPDDVCLPKDEADPHKWYMSPCNDGGRVGAGAMTKWCDKFMYFKVPSGITPTEKATLQWYWKTGNSCTPGPNATGTCEYVKKRKRPDDWCAKQWSCVNCKTHPGKDADYFDFKHPSTYRKACSEVFTNCADVRLSASEGDTKGPSGKKDAFEGNGRLTARSCTSDLLNIVYNDTKKAYTVQGGGGGGASGGGTSGGGGGGGKDEQSCLKDGKKCYVKGWADPCHPTDKENVCKRAGGRWLGNTKPVPTPEPEPESHPPPMSAPEPEPPAPPGKKKCFATDTGRRKQGVTDAHCKPCGKGQPWWPCQNLNTKVGFCKCTTSLVQQESNVSDDDAVNCAQWTSISDQATNDWCESNCVSANLLHPACNPETDDVHKKCVCGHMPEELIQTVPATKFSGSIGSLLKVSQHVNVDDTGALEFANDSD